MSNGHRHHSFHHRKDEDDNSVNVIPNYAYGSAAVQLPDVSSDYQTAGYDYKAGNDDRNVSLYNADNDQTGSGYNPCNGYRPGSVYNACNDYRPGSTYNALVNDYRTVSAYNAGYQKGYNAGSDYQQDQPSDKYEIAPKVEKYDKPMEHVGKLGAMAAGGSALNERPELKADPELAVASGRFALHKQNQKKEHAKEAIDRRKQRRRSF